MAASRTLTPEQRVERAQRAGRASARRARAANLARLIESAPPLEPEDRDRIAALLFAHPVVQPEPTKRYTTDNAAAAG